jgi:hypothetical protein
MKHFVVLSLVLLASACSSSNGSDGAVLTPEVAIAKAKESWSGVYRKTHDPTLSEESVKRFEPYTATLADGVWTIRGTMPADFHDGAPIATVRQADGLASVTSEKR